MSSDQKYKVLRTKSKLNRVKCIKNKHVVDYFAQKGDDELDIFEQGPVDFTLVDLKSKVKADK